VTDAADDGLDHLELRFSPRFIETVTGLAGDAVIDAIADGVAAAGREQGLTIGLIAIVVRDLGPVAGAGQMERILARRDRFVAVDLAGDEAGFPPPLFAEPFRRAREAGLGVTIHAGEAAGPASVAAALDHLHPDRIGHGVRSAEDPRLMERLAREDVTLEVALTSNVDTGAAASLARHQIRTLLAAGVPVTLNTDNPTVSRTTLSRELAGAARAAGLTPDDCRAVTGRAVRAAFRRP
jgi:adenosine deaminase